MIENTARSMPVSRIFKMISISMDVPTQASTIPGHLCYVRNEKSWYFWNEEEWVKLGVVHIYNTPDVRMEATKSSEKAEIKEEPKQESVQKTNEPEVKTDEQKEKVS